MSDTGSVGALCFVELVDADVVDASLRALTFARGLAELSHGSLDAVCVGPVGPSALATLGAYGVRQVHRVSVEGLDVYAPVAWARAVGELTHSLDARALVAAGTDRGHEVAAHVGAARSLPVVANCLRVAAGDGSSLRLTRQRWGGSLFEELELDVTPAVVSVATDGVVAEAAATPIITAVREVSVTPTVADGAVRVVQWRARAGGVSLADARVVVGGGRGVGSEERFAALDELAHLLGAAVGVSRAVTSAGWRPHAQQVGQTGTRIAPDLYLACGISGATQHLAGCRSAKHVVAINVDADAPLLARADYAIVGDLHEVVPALVAEIRARRSTTSSSASS